MGFSGAGTKAGHGYAKAVNFNKTDHKCTVPINRTVPLSRERDRYVRLYVGESYGVRPRTNRSVPRYDILKASFGRQRPVFRLETIFRADLTIGLELPPDVPAVERRDNHKSDRQLGSEFKTTRNFCDFFLLKTSDRPYL